jgi:chemotaxis protein histidine kinase CheA
MDLTEFLNEFQLEAGEKLDIMASQLLRLERDATNPQPIREMFLAAHTIKGGAAMLRLTDVEALAHAVEDLLSTFRDGARTLDAPTADLLFQSIDQLRSLVTAADAASVGAEPDPAIEQFSARLRGSAGGAVARPAPVRAALAPRVEAPTLVAAAPAPVPLATLRALVVDDSPTVRELHRILLEDVGYEVVTCEDGQAALAAATAEPFALVVSGVLVKARGGFEVCAALRDVPVLLVSADADPEMVRKASEAGARALVRKGSLDAERFIEAVREIAGLTV